MDKAKNLTREEFAEAVVEFMSSRPHTEYRMLTVINRQGDQPKRPDFAPNFPWHVRRAEDDGESVWIIQYLYPVEMAGY